MATASQLPASMRTLLKALNLFREAVHQASRQLINQKTSLGAFKILTQQVVKCMRGAVPVQNFPWPIVEQCLHSLDLAP